MTRRIGSTLFWVFLAVSCLVMFAGAVVVFLVTAPFDRNRRIHHLYSSFWAQLYFYVNPLWRLRIEGRDRLPRHGPGVIVSNHQSLGDILVLFGLYRPFKWVSKASVFNVPFVGWNMRMAGYVPLVRGKGESVRRMMSDCHRWLGRGEPVLLFPEGTRSPDENVRPFKDGAFRLAVEAGVPVYPIALTGTAATLPKHGFLLGEPANCRVRVLPPVHPEDHDDDPERLRDHVRDRIIEAKAELDAERSPPVEATG